MATLITNYTNFIPPSSTSVLKSGTGKIHAILATSLSTTPATIVIYDNTSGSGNILHSFQVAAPHPVCIVLPNYLALRFYVGLTVVTPANVYCYLATEESQESFSPPVASFTTLHCRLYNSANISVAHDTWTTGLTFNSEQSDQGGMHSTVTNTNRITFPEAGFYVFGAQASFAANATGLRGLFIYGLGGYVASDLRNNLGAYNDTIVQLSSGADFAAGQSITVGAYQNSGAALNILASANSPAFWAARVL
jgi:hypothetical protein